MPWITEHSMASPFHILWVTNYQREKAVYTTIPGPLISSLLSAVSFQVFRYETFLTVWWLLILRSCLGMLPVEGEASLSPSLLHREQSTIPPWPFWSHSAERPGNSSYHSSWNGRLARAGMFCHKSLKFISSLLFILSS